MNHYFNRKIARQSELILDIVFLMIHLCFLYYFYKLEVEFMVYVNIVSVATYIIGYFMITQGRMIPFYYVASVEIAVHMILATICVGMAPGFHWILLFLPVLFFFTDFFSLQIRGKTAMARTGSLLAMASILFLEFYMSTHEPIYKIPDWVGFYTRILVVIMIFTIAFFLLRILTKFAYLSENKLHEKAVTDALTGLYNRFEIMDELDLRFQRHELEHAWIAIIDLDDFKKVNETFGYGVGDHILMQVADVLRGMRKDLVCARWGGDDFMVCCFDREGEQKAYEEMDWLRQQLQSITFEMFDDAVKVQATIGIAFYKDGESVKDWVAKADKKVHAGKYNGKNRVIL